MDFLRRIAGKGRFLSGCFPTGGHLYSTPFLILANPCICRPDVIQYCMKLFIFTDMKEGFILESASYRRPFLLEQLVRWLKEAFLDNRVPFLSALLFGFLAHGYAFANKLLSYDEVGSLFDKGTTATSGRWGLDLLSFVFPDFSIPWFYGILSVLLLSVAACIVVRIFAIRSKVLQGLLAGSILVFPSLTATVIYMYTLCSYAVSFLMAVAAVWLLQKKSWPTALASLVCMIFSLGIYQAYISITASFLVLILIQDLLKDRPFRRVVRKGFLFLGFLIVSLLAYLLVTRIYNIASGLTLNSYADQRITFSLSYLPTGILEAYRAFVRFFLDGKWGLMPMKLSQIVHIVCVLAVLVLLAVWLLQKKRSVLELALLGILLLLLPLAINCMYLFVTADPSLCAIHTLVLYGFIGVYVFAAILADVCDVPAFFTGAASWITLSAQNILLFGLLASILINTYVANSLYLSLHLRYENAYGFYSTLLSQLQQHPEYDENTEITLIGHYEEAGFYGGELDYLQRIMGADGFQPDSHSGWYFLYYYFGLKVPFTSDERKNQIRETEEFSQMPVYPYYGSIRMIDDVMVVKLS